MSLKSSKSSQRARIARYGIDMLAVYVSQNATPVSLDEAMDNIRKLFSGKLEKEKPHVIKCMMHILDSNDGSYIIILKSHNNKKILETFSMKSIGTPQVGQISSQSLVFLPVLNKNFKSELFVFHPNTVTAQEVVIKLVTLMQLKDSHTDGSHDSPCPPKSDFGECEIGEYSLSSTFIKNWFSKLEHIVIKSPNSPYQRSEYSPSVNSTTDQLGILHQNIRDIRNFMSNLYVLMKQASHTVHNNHQVVKLPSRAQFIEIVHKIKSTLNIASIHEESIVRPSAKEIVNQLMLILKIIGDATTDKRTGTPYLIFGISDPYINGATAKYLRDHLTSVNKYFWMSLGRNYGYDAPHITNTQDRQRREFDEFQIKHDASTETNEGRHDEGYENFFYPIPNEFHQSGSNTRIVDNTYFRESSIDEGISVENFTGRNIPRNNLNMNNSTRQPPHLSFPGMSIHQTSGARSQMHDQCTSRWDDKQCRFIDAVQLRSGRLLRISQDKRAQGNRDISVHCNEIVELLSDHGETYSVKNSLGEVGYCPASIAAPIITASL